MRDCNLVEAVIDKRISSHQYFERDRERERDRHKERALAMASTHVKQLCGACPQDRNSKQLISTDVSTLVAHFQWRRVVHLFTAMDSRHTICHRVADQSRLLRHQAAAVRARKTSEGPSVQRNSFEFVF